ncbi:hypothetical protein ZWY2020_044173 [Hordeum vulgare]|nr:hypothetical protein ZWY2020_044173 [Hordeum vulgare]
MDDLSPRVEMAESDAAAGKMANGEASDDNRSAVEVAGGEDTLPAVLRSFVDGIWPPPGNGGDPLLQRLHAASCEAAPRLWGTSRNSARDLLPWAKQGSGLRAILVISVNLPLPALCFRSSIHPRPRHCLAPWQMVHWMCLKCRSII